MADPMENIEQLDVSDSDKSVLKKYGGVAEPEEKENLPPLEMEGDAEAPWDEEEEDA